MMVSFATILGCLAMPWLAERLGRRGALGVYFTLMMIFIALTFGKVFYLGAKALPWMFVSLFFLGLGGANFAVYTLWLPEQYPRNAAPALSLFLLLSPALPVLELLFSSERVCGITARSELPSQ